MKPIGPVFLNIILIVCGAYVVLGALTQCAPLSASKKSIEKQFEANPNKPAFYTYDVGGQTMHCASIGNDSLPLIIFVHGSPGGWDAYLDYFKDTALTNHAMLVSVDRIGYGGSEEGRGEKSLQKQGAAIAPLFKLSKSAKKPILVGHSLGGPIIARMAMDYPNALGSLIMLAPSIDPGMEKYEWYRPIFKLGVIRAIFPPGLQASNTELMPLKGELEKMLPLWQNIIIPCTIMHGKKDMLVPYGNVPFFEKMLVNAPKKEVVAFENENHFIPWTQYKAVRDKILEHMANNK